MNDVHRRAPGLEAADALLNRLIGNRDPLVLTQVLQPALGQEYLDVTTGVGRIDEVLPEDRAVAPSGSPRPGKRGGEFILTSRVDPVLDLDHYRALIGLTILDSDHRLRPVHRRRQL